MTCTGGGIPAKHMIYKSFKTNALTDANNPPQHAALDTEQNLTDAILPHTEEVFLQTAQWGRAASVGRLQNR